MTTPFTPGKIYPSLQPIEGFSRETSLQNMFFIMSKCEGRQTRSLPFF